MSTYVDSTDNSDEVSLKQYDIADDVDADGMWISYNPRSMQTNSLGFQEPFFGEADPYLKSGADANPCVVTDQFHKKLVHNVAADLKLEYCDFNAEGCVDYYECVHNQNHHKKHLVSIGSNPDLGETDSTYNVTNRLCLPANAPDVIRLKHFTCHKKVDPSGM